MLGNEQQLTGGDVFSVDLELYKRVIAEVVARVAVRD